MKSVRLSADGTGRSRPESLPLPFVATGPAATAADRAATPEPDPAGSVVAVHPLALPAGHGEMWAGEDTRQLTFVVSGGIEVETSQARVQLGPGDVLLLDAGLRADHRLTHPEGSRVLRVELLPSWRPTGVVPPPVEPPAPDRRTTLREMYVAEDVAHFRAFDRLFDDAGPQRLDGLKFIAFSPGHAGDWHTDATVNLVCVASGTLELEVGGDDAVQRLVPGDVCLVQDQYGQGHLLRAHGETRILALTLPDLHHWNSTEGRG
ncbi:hypothetical protein [Pseudonocardia ailaonensis]